MTSKAGNIPMFDKVLKKASLFEVVAFGKMRCTKYFEYMAVDLT